MVESKVPTEPGWYWYGGQDDWAPVWVSASLTEGLLAAHPTYGYHFVSWFTPERWGPRIPTPDEMATVHANEP